MKALYTLFLFLLAGTAYGQSNLYAQVSNGEGFTPLEGVSTKQQINITSSENEREDKFWEDVKFTGNKKAFEAYIKKYPNGRFLDLANASIGKLSEEESKTATSSTDQEKIKSKSNISDKISQLESSSWVKNLELNAWVLQHGAFDSLTEARTYQSSAVAYKSGKILFSQSKGSKPYYILITGPYADKLQVEILMKQTPLLGKAWLRSVKSLKEQIVTQIEKKSVIQPNERFDTNYFQFEKELVTNITGSKKVMEVQLAVMTHYDSRVFDNIKKHEFVLRSAMLNQMRKSTEAEVNKPDFRKELCNKLKDIMNSLLEEYEDFGGIEDLFFTSFH